MLRSVQYVVALFLFTGSICLADPLEIAKTYYKHMPQTSHDTDEIKDKLTKGIVAGCPYWSPSFETTARAAIDNLGTCVASKKIEMDQELEDIRAFYPSERAQEAANVLCRYTSSLTCARSFFNSIKLCVSQNVVEKQISDYKGRVSIRCANDGKKLAAAMMELGEEEQPCRDMTSLRVRKCLLNEKYGNIIIHDKDDVCRETKCIKAALNVCGGPKKNMNEIYDGIIAWDNRNGGCNDFSSTPSSTFASARSSRFHFTRSSTHTFCPNIVVSTVAVFMATFASRFTHRGSLS